MPLPDLAANTVVLASFVGNCNGQRIINTFHYRLSTAPTVGVQYDSYMNKLFLQMNAAGAIIDRFCRALTADYTLEKVRLQPVYPSRQRYINYPLTVSGSFNSPSGVLSPNQNMASSIKRVSNAIGPKGVGRIQMILPERQSSGGFLVDVNGYKTALQTLGGNFLDQYTTVTPNATWIPTLYGPGYTTTGINDLVNWEVEDTVRTMHRRTTFLGE